MPSLNHVKLLANLARADGSVTDREKNYVVNIAKANGIGAEQVMPWFDEEQDVVLPSDLSADEKFDFIFSMVQLMKVDERMYKEEIVFCAHIAEKLGYQQQVMFDLMLRVKATAMHAEEIDSLKALTQRYLNT